MSYPTFNEKGERIMPPAYQPATWPTSRPINNVKSLQKRMNRQARLEATLAEQLKKLGEAR